MENFLVSWSPVNDNAKPNLILSDYKGQTMELFEMFLEYRKINTDEYKIQFSLKIDAHYPPKRTSFEFTYNPTFIIKTLPEFSFKNKPTMDEANCLIPILLQSIVTIKFAFDNYKTTKAEFKEIAFPYFTDTELINNVLMKSSVRQNPKLN